MAAGGHGCQIPAGAGTGACDELRPDEGTLWKPIAPRPTSVVPIRPVPVELRPGRRPVTTNCCAIALIATAVSLGACTPAPPPDGPGARNAHGLAFDGRVALLFGGATDREVRGDTWGWDGRRWWRFDVGGPSPRTFPVMVAAGTGDAYLFGGRRVLFGTSIEPSQLVGDLWLWRRGLWTRVDVPGPEPRAEAAGAWDPRRRRLVVFGGYTVAEGAVRPLADTWEFGDGQWTRFDVEGPGARHGAGMAFDHASAEVVLFGGNGGRTDQWAWNGRRWRVVPPLATTGSPPGAYLAAVTATDRLGIVRVGGWNGRARVDDVWALANGGWTKLAPGPHARNHAAMTYDDLRRRVVLVGGHDGEHVFGDVWELADATWRRVFDGGTALRVENGH